MKNNNKIKKTNVLEHNQTSDQKKITGLESDNSKSFRSEKFEKTPILGFTGILDLFILFCGSLSILYSLRGIHTQSALFIIIGIAFYFARNRLSIVYQQTTLMTINSHAVFLTLGVAPLILIIFSILAKFPEGMFIILPSIIGFFAITININRQKKKISLVYYAILLILLMYLFNNNSIDYTWTNIIFIVMNLIILL